MLSLRTLQSSYTFKIIVVFCEIFSTYGKPLCNLIKNRFWQKLYIEYDLLLGNCYIYSVYDYNSIQPFPAYSSWTCWGSRAYSWGCGAKAVDMNGLNEQQTIY